MGNENERKRINNQHEENISQINSMKKEKEMQASLNKFAEENKFKSSLEDSKRLSRKDENDHERIMQELFDEKQEKIHEKNNERKRDEKFKYTKREESNGK